MTDEFETADSRFPEDDFYFGTPNRAPVSAPAPPDTAPAPPREPSVLRELGALVFKIAAIAIVFILIFTFVYGFCRNTDPDMAPAVKDGDLVLFYRLDKDYAIGDLLLIDFKGESQVRRVIAKAGDTVDITNEGLVVNGALQQETNIYESTRRYENDISFPLTVGQGQVFVLGDARENATDSRIYGPVDTKDTLGKVITIIRRRSL